MTKQEIERKFLVLRDKLPDLPESERYVQAYLSMNPTVRVRIIDGNMALMTVKGAGLKSRVEIEFPVPIEDANDMVKLSPYCVIHKTRHKLDRGDLTWEIDFYEGDLAGLITAEVELPSEGHEVDLPEFVGREVTERADYKNAALAEHGMPRA